MSTGHGFWFTPLVLVTACTGLDPDAFKKGGSVPEPDGAGWSFDAGVATEAGGGGTRAIGGGTGGSSLAGSDGMPDGGAAPGSDAGGDDGGGTGEGGSGGGSGSGSGGGGTAGRGGGVGSAGGASATGGRAGQAGAGQGGKGLAGTSAGGATEAHVLFFSEYVEGSSSYKALELTAREDSTLTGCRLVTYFNGATTGTGIALDGSLPAGSTYVLCSSGLGPLLEKACERTTNLTFNGDDAVALECDGTTLDVIGQIGVDPGDAWTSAEASTLNQTLRRRCAVIIGDADGSDAFEPTTEWTAFPIDTFDGLGVTECPIEARR